MAVIVGSVGRYNSYSWGMAITAGATYTGTLYSNYFTGSLRVNNGPYSNITGLYVVPAGAASWGANQLSSSVPLTGVYVLNDIDAGNWDIQCVHADGTTNTGYAIGISSLSYTTVTCN
jgi:hypothetical protein